MAAMEAMEAMVQSIEDTQTPHGSLGDLLRQHRLARGLTQEALAERARLGVRTIGALERGHGRPPRSDTVALLADALGLPPNVRAAFAAAASGGDRGVPRRQDNLPADLTPFVAREQEVADVWRLVGQHRLVTLTGTGGVGKTRLAIETARRRLPVTPDGVWLVDLAPLADPEQVQQAVAGTLHVAPAPGRGLLISLAEALRPRRVLLVLDNCEHLVGACAALVEDLLRACPVLHVLATSREPLGCAGEAVWSVPSFAVPAVDAVLNVADLTGFGAVRLFVDRAAAAQPGFALSELNVGAVVEICRRLDGIPLALELAAARIRGLSIDEIAARLDARFQLLTGGHRTALPRHQTLRAMVEWSYALLSPSEQTMFDRLSVFAGSFTLAAAEAVGADDPVGALAPAAGHQAGTLATNAPPNGSVRAAPDEGRISFSQALDVLLRLVDKGLVFRGLDVVRESPGASDERRDNGATDHGSGGRYRLLETLREYGQERLTQKGHREAVRRRHLDYYLGLVDQAGREDDRSIQAPLLRLLTSERENLWAALRWAGDRTDVGMDSETNRRLEAALTRFADRLAIPTIRDALTPLVAELRRLRLPAYAALKQRLLEHQDAATLTAAADLYQIVGDRVVEFAVVQCLLEAEQDEAARAFAGVRYAWLLLIRNDVRQATAVLESVAAWAQAHQHEVLLLDVVLVQGYAHFKAGDVRRGRRAYAQGLALLERLRPRLADETYRAKRLVALRGQGCVEHNADANAACLSMHTEGLDLARQLDDLPNQAVELVNLADAQWGCWRYGDALGTYRKAVEAAAAACYPSQGAFARLGRGAVLWSAGQHTAAAESLAAGLALADDLEDTWIRAYGLTYLSNVQASIGDLATALRTSRDAVALARDLGAGYPLGLALLNHLWQQEVAAPGQREHGAEIEDALRKAGALGLAGLALQLAWVRLLHRVARPGVADRLLVCELEALVAESRAHPPVKGAWELLGLQVTQALHAHRPHEGAIAARGLQDLIDEVCAAKAASLAPGDRKTYLRTRRCWETHAR